MVLQFENVSFIERTGKNRMLVKTPLNSQPKCLDSQLYQ
jgi:hypothetical protein